MKKERVLSERGLGKLGVVLTIIVLGAAAGFGWVFYSKQSDNNARDQIQNELRLTAQYFNEGKASEVKNQETPDFVFEMAKNKGTKDRDQYFEYLTKLFKETSFRSCESEIVSFERLSDKAKVNSNMTCLVTAPDDHGAPTWYKLVYNSDNVWVRQNDSWRVQFKKGLKQNYLKP